MAMMLEPAGEDLDYLIRTVYGEAANEPAEGQMGVAAVIRNRARQAGLPIRDIVMSPHQFEPWSSRRNELMSLDRDSPAYQSIARNISGGYDPTGGADHFYSPTTQDALGREAPAWAKGRPGLDIGRHRFFKLGYSGAGRPVQTAAAATAPQSVSGAADPSTWQTSVHREAAPAEEQSGNRLARAARSTTRLASNPLSLSMYNQRRPQFSRLA
jgi:hypothetical protein